MLISHCSLVTSYGGIYLVHIGPGNSLVPVLHQSIIWSNADLSLIIGPLEAYFYNW